MAFGVEPINPFYSMYAVTLYINTGFDVVNVPEKPDVLVSAASTILTMPSIDIYQEYQLSNVSVRVTEENKAQAVFADYIQVGDAYYAVTGYQFTSYDVLTFGVYFEALLSARAKGAITSLGGTTVRRRVTEAEDTFGAYTEDDELLTPQENLKLVVGTMLWSNRDTTSGLIGLRTAVVESLADLTVAGTNAVAVTYTDADGNSVTIPIIASLSADKETVYHSDSHVLPTRGSGLFVKTLVTDGISRCRSLGYDSAIIKSFELPDQFVELTRSTTNEGVVTQADGKSESKTSDVYTINYATVKNKKLLYGRYNIFGFITAGGSKLEANPEQIASDFSDSITISMKADPRPDGAPYFRFTIFNGDSSDTGFWINAVRGEGWTESPLYYTSAAGTYKLTHQFVMNNLIASETQRINQNTALRNLSQSELQSALSIPQKFLSAITGKDKQQRQYDAVRGMASGVGSGILNTYNATIDYNNQEYLYNLSRAKELQNFGYTATEAYAPSVEFVPNSQIIRDILGNGIIPYRYEYSENDLKRIDILLTMYGYKETEPFKASMLVDHKDFEYLQLANVSIQADSIPMWWRNQVASELNSGIRIWHVKPDFGYFDGTKTVE